MRLKLRPAARRRAFVPLLAAAVVWAAWEWPNADAQGQVAPVFRGGTDVVQVPVRVLDRDRKPVRDLVASDFTVLVDDVPQPIVAVTAEDAEGPIHPSAPWMRDVAPDVATNANTDGRLIVILMEDADFSGDAWQVDQVRQITRAIVDELGPSDLVSIVFDGDNRQPQDFTSDRRRLLDTIARWHVTGTAGLGRKYSRNALLAAVAFLKSARDRASAIFVVGGVDVGRDEVQQMTQGVSTDRMYGIPVYPISPFGFTGRVPLDGGPMGLVARATGGRAVFDTNTPVAEIPAVFAEMNVRYVIGYRPTYPLTDGRYRTLRIQVNRPDVTVEPSERIFRTPAPASADTTAAAGPATTAAMSGIVPLADEPLRLAVASFAAPATPRHAGDGTAAVTLSLGLDLPLLEGQRSAGDTLDIEVRVFDGEGRKQVLERHETTTFSAGFSRATGFDWQAVLALKPGRYNLRVSTHSAARDKSGSVYTDLVVPDFRNAPVSTSGVVLGAVPGRLATPAGALRSLLPVVPTTARDFAATDRVTAFVRVYWGGTGAAAPVSMRAEIIDTSDTTVFSQTTPLTPAAGTTPRSADYALALPLARLAPGEFVLTVDATPATGAALRHSVRFRVR